MHTLAVYGWDEHEPRLLNALQHAAPFRLAAVGDGRTAALVRARAATGSPCYQHATEMFRREHFDAALLASAAGAAQVAQAAAGSGAAVLLAGDQADGGTILEAGEAALRARVPFAVLRPRLQHAGIAFLLNLVASEPGWRPCYLEATLAGPADALELIRNAVAVADRLMQTTPDAVSGTAIGGDEVAATAATGELRYDGRLATLRARGAEEDRVTLLAECPLGQLELTTLGAHSTVTMTLRDGRRETSRLTDRDPFVLEAQRAARALTGEGGDALLAPRDGSVLLALEQAMDTGQVVLVEERSSRANLVLVESHGAPTSTPRGRLHLVGV
ncbi:MAG: hypothetical protein AB7G21_03475 [Dehalococcoidia bacterium]